MNVPGVMAILVAPLAVQLRVLAVPEFMLVGFAVKDVLVGAEPVSEVDFDGVDNPQPARAAQANRMRRRAQKSGRTLRGLRLFPKKL